MKYFHSFLVSFNFGRRNAELCCYLFVGQVQGLKETDGGGKLLLLVGKLLVFACKLLIFIGKLLVLVRNSALQLRFRLLPALKDGLELVLQVHVLADALVGLGIDKTVEHVAVVADVGALVHAELVGTAVGLGLVEQGQELV